MLVRLALATKQKQFKNKLSLFALDAHNICTSINNPLTREAVSQKTILIGTQPEHTGSYVQIMNNKTI